MKTERILAPFDWFLIIGILVTTVVYSILAGELDWLAITASILNIVCVVLTAKGSIWNYLFGIIYVLIYAWICFSTDHFGNAAVYALVFFPMNVIGYFQWKRRGTVGDSGQVAARRLTGRQTWIIAALSAVIMVGAWFLLNALGGKDTVADSMLTVLCIIAQVLMMLAYTEQWVLWIAVNVITVVMWMQAAFSGTPHAVVMVINYVFCMINSVNGMRVWLRLSRRS